MKKLEIQPEKTIGKYAGIASFSEDGITFTEITKNGDTVEDFVAYEELQKIFEGKDVKLNISGVNPEDI